MIQLHLHETIIKNLIKKTLLVKGDLAKVIT